MKFQDLKNFNSNKLELNILKNIFIFFKFLFFFCCILFIIFFIHYYFFLDIIECSNAGQPNIFPNHSRHKAIIPTVETEEFFKKLTEEYNTLDEASKKAKIEEQKLEEGKKNEKKF